MEVSKVEGTVAAEEEAEEMEEEMEDAATAAEPDEKEVIAAEASVLEAAAEAMAEVKTVLSEAAAGAATAAAANEDAANEDAANEDAVNEDAVNEDVANEDAVEAQPSEPPPAGQTLQEGEEEKAAGPPMSEAEPTDSELLTFLLGRSGLSRADAVKQLVDERKGRPGRVRFSTTAAAEARADDADSDEEDEDDESHNATLEAHAALLHQAIGGPVESTDAEDESEETNLLSRVRTIMAEADDRFGFSRPVLD